MLQDESSAKVHSIVVIHDGKLVYEKYLSGDDEKLGWTVKGRTFDASMKHDVRSITKSVVSLLYGIALAEGSVPPLDASLVDSFPEYPEASADPAKRKMTVGDALTMSLGLEWNEDAPGDENTETQMEDAPDLVRFVLERPVAAEPGTVWVYNGGATSLLARIIARGTGMSIAAARRYYEDPRLPTDLVRRRRTATASTYPMPTSRHPLACEEASHNEKGPGLPGPQPSRAVGAPHPPLTSPRGRRTGT